MPAGVYGEVKCSLRKEIASRDPATYNSAVLAAPPPQIASEEASLPRPYRLALSQIAQDTVAPWRPTPLGSYAPSAPPARSAGILSSPSSIFLPAPPSSSPPCGTDMCRRRHSWPPSLPFPISPLPIPSPPAFAHLTSADTFPPATTGASYHQLV
ncbi:classical arabinogalactan protein 9-like [Hyalella azteca]|uniref:Classical arabinogalactan protein 9-like n=1 Tax=Hyalella azteca TaxID=294128 RepID=A0A8B7N104_HYAAZ|nr:classical arabinogalactan protein 9-like [Hyalella azteca]